MASVDAQGPIVIFAGKSYPELSDPKRQKASTFTGFELRSFE